jgi:hypothetical protein
MKQKPDRPSGSLGGSKSTPKAKSNTIYWVVGIAIAVIAALVLIF